jgi:Family of unknown function (DUF5695)
MTAALISDLQFPVFLFLRKLTVVSRIDSVNWWSWDKAPSFATDLAYDYVHVLHMSKPCLNYPVFVKTLPWHLNQVVLIVTTLTDESVGFVNVGLMGETVSALLLLTISSGKS